MKRWELAKPGRENLRLVDAAIPEPDHGELLIQVTAVSLNYRDRLVVENGMRYPLDLPFTESDLFHSPTTSR